MPVLQQWRRKAVPITPILALMLSGLLVGCTYDSFGYNGVYVPMPAVAQTTGPEAGKGVVTGAGGSPSAQPQPASIPVYDGTAYPSAYPPAYPPAYGGYAAPYLASTIAAATVFGATFGGGWGVAYPYYRGWGWGGVPWGWGYPGFGWQQWGWGGPYYRSFGW
ncbi:hypothetical protein [Granulibacter bethesdensis]|uniref:hypothetical protein n=1 Tax=Granulibacter bethesdensis TaxID=364410 RepID=UPI00093506DA|nr:hypothetical protein [Granulibacter bethesdensis]